MSILHGETNASDLYRPMFFTFLMWHKINELVKINKTATKKKAWKEIFGTFLWRENVWKLIEVLICVIGFENKWEWFVQWEMKPAFVSFMRFMSSIQ